VARRALLDEALRPSSTPPKSYGGGSGRKRVAQILSNEVRDVSPCMKRSFAEGRYSPSTSMDRSEWKILLE
jgi:hypothetical protein